MADKKKAGSLLMASLGRTKKEQMKALTPPSLKKSRTSTSIKSKGPYIRGTIGKKATFEERRKVIRGPESFKERRAIIGGLPKPTKEKGIVGAAAAGAAGYALGKYGPKKTKAKETTSHKDKARKMADDAVKKQKKKKEKHHSR